MYFDANNCLVVMVPSVTLISFRRCLTDRLTTSCRLCWTRATSPLRVLPNVFSYSCNISSILSPVNCGSHKPLSTKTRSCSVTRAPNSFTSSAKPPSLVLTKSPFLYLLLHSGIHTGTIALQVLIYIVNSFLYRPNLQTRHHF